MNGHIEDAKRDLNFSTFASYKISKQYRLFDNINKEVKNGDMPLSSYTFIHRDAILNDAQKLAIATGRHIPGKKSKAITRPIALNPTGLPRHSKCHTKN